MDRQIKAERAWKLPYVIADEIGSREIGAFAAKDEQYYINLFETKKLHRYNTLIRTLVKKVVLYDDRIQIYYNYADRKTQKKNEGSDGDEADQTFCFYDGDKTFPLTNYKLRSNPHELTLRVSLYI